MRIVHIIDTLNPAAGGPATVIARLAAAQASLGHMVTILSYIEEGERAVVDKNLHGIPDIDKVKLEFIPTHGGFDWVLVLSARDSVHRIVRNATVVHLHGVWEPLLHVASKYARRYKIPYVVRPAGMLDPWSLRQRWLKKFVAMRLGYRRMFDRCAFMHTLNADERDLIQRLKLRCRLEVIPNGVFPQEFEHLPQHGTFQAAHPELRGKPFVLFLSRLHYKKGLDYLAEGFANAAKRNDSLHLVVAGPDGGAREDFISRIDAAGISDRVHLVGPLYGSEKFAALVDAELFTLPSRQEGFSLAITEALAIGQPVVITPECHFPEVEAAGAGKIVSPEPKKIGDAIIDITSDPALRRSMGAAGAKLVRENFTWPKIAHRTIDAYDDAFARSPRNFHVENPKRMHIVHVISSMAVEAGGPPAVCAGLAGAQAALGHRVTIAAVDIPGKKRVAIPPGVELADFPITGVERYASSPELGKWLLANGQNVDMFHLHSIWQYPTFAAARVCWKYKKPYVVLLNGMLDTYSVKNRHLLLKRFYWKLRESRVLSRAQGLHCLNISEITKAMNWIDNFPKFICGNGISARQFDEMPERGQFRAAHPEIGDRPFVLFMSRIHPKKGLDRLLPVWKTVVDRFPDSRFAIAGAGDADYTALIDKLIKDHNLSEHVIRVGQLAGATKWQAIVDADLFVLPSHQEGFSMAITESLAAGIPAVATTECNFTQLTTDDCGVEVGNADMSAFARITADLLADPARRKRLGDNGRKLVRSRFTWEGITADLQHVYEWILSGRPLPPDGADVWRPAVPLHPQINGVAQNLSAPAAVGH